MGRVIAVLAVALLILHQDFWWWEDRSLVFGLLPVGLAYHALYSLLAAALWAFAIQVAWPARIVAFADEGGDAPAAPDAVDASA